MNVIRVAKTARNRVDVVFAGDKYLFFNPDNDKFNGYGVCINPDESAKTGTARRKPPLLPL